MLSIAGLDGTTSSEKDWVNFFYAMFAKEADIGVQTPYKEVLAPEVLLTCNLKNCSGDVVLYMRERCTVNSTYDLRKRHKVPILRKLKSGDIED